MQFTEVHEHTIHFAREGQGDGAALIFAHSLGCDLRSWDGVVPAFAGRFDVLRYDLRGHGLSDCPPGPYTVEAFAGDLAGLLDQLEIDRAVVVGISISGMIALQFAALHPERVGALVLSDSGMRIGTPEGWDERIAALRREGMEALAETILARWFAPDFKTRRPREYRGYFNLLCRTPLEGYIASCAALRDADLGASAKAIQSKVLVLGGEQDLATPAGVVEALAEAVPGARLEIIPGAAHLPCVEQPAAMASAIDSFLREVGWGGR